MELERSWLTLVEENMNIPTHKIIKQNEENSQVISNSTNFPKPFLNDEVITAFKDIPVQNPCDHQCGEIEPVVEDEVCINMQEINNEVIFPESCESIEQRKQNKYEEEDVQQRTSYVHTDKAEEKRHGKNEKENFF